METYEEKVRRVLEKEAEERLIIAIQIYNNTIRAEENYMNGASGDLWFGLMGVMVAYPSGVAIFFLFMFFVGLWKYVHRCWRLSLTKNVSILENPEEAASYRYNRRYKLQPINLFLLVRTNEGEASVMKRLYDEVITDEMKSDRDLVVKRLMEAGLRHVIVDSITGNHIYIDYPENLEEVDEDSFWESGEED